MPTRRVFMEAASGAVLAALATGTASAASPCSAAQARAAHGRRRPALATRSYCFFSKHLPDLNWTDLAAATIDMGFDGIDLTVRPKGHVAARARRGGSAARARRDPREGHARSR